MDDLEITRRCAEAMGGGYTTYPDGVGRFVPDGAPPAQNIFAFDRYDPLHDDAQAMALVKRFELDISAPDPENGHLTWAASSAEGGIMSAPDLNRAICLAVAQRGKK